MVDVYVDGMAEVRIDVGKIPFLNSAQLRFESAMQIHIFCCFFTQSRHLVSCSNIFLSLKFEKAILKFH